MNWDKIRDLRMAQQVAAVADAPALTSAASAAAPTKVEFDKVVADLAALRTAHNNLRAALRASRVLSS